MREIHFDKTKKKEIPQTDLWTGQKLINWEGGGGGLLPADEPLLLSVRILLLETAADKFPTGISDAARKLCYWLDWCSSSCQKDLSRYQMGFCCCKQWGILQEKLDALSKCYAISYNTRWVSDFLGSIWNSAASQWRSFCSLALPEAWKLPPLSFLDKEFSSPINFIYTLFQSKEILNFLPPWRDCNQLNLLISFNYSQEYILIQFYG